MASILCQENWQGNSDCLGDEPIIRMDILWLLGVFHLISGSHHLNPFEGRKFYGQSMSKCCQKKATNKAGLKATSFLFHQTRQFVPLSKPNLAAYPKTNNLFLQMNEAEKTTNSHSLCKTFFLVLRQSVEKHCAQFACRIKS